MGSMMVSAVLQSSPGTRELGHKDVLTVIVDKVQLSGIRKYKM